MTSAAVTSVALVAALFGTGGLLYTFMEFLKDLVSSDWSSVKNQLAAWIAGVGLSLLVSGSQLGHLVQLPIDNTMTFGSLSITSRVLIGLLLAGSTGVSYKAAKTYATPKVVVTSTAIEPAITVAPDPSQALPDPVAAAVPVVTTPTKTVDQAA